MSIRVLIAIQYSVDSKVHSTMLDRFKAAARTTGEKVGQGAQKTKALAKVTGEKMKEGAQATKEATLDIRDGVKEFQADYEKKKEGEANGESNSGQAEVDAKKNGQTDTKKNNSQTGSAKK